MSGGLPRCLIAIALVLTLSVGAHAAPEPEESYSQPVVNAIPPHSTHWDILVIPPAHGQVFNGNGVLNGGDTRELDPLSSSYVAAIENAVATWKTSIDTLGVDWIQGALTFDLYVVGRDTIPPSALADPEVVFSHHEASASILGVTFRGFMVANGPCWITDVSFGYFPLSLTAEDMYNIASHEFGHCLGLSHVTDTSDDMMFPTYTHSIGAKDNPLYCVSNLNVRGVESYFQRVLLGTTGPSSVSVSASDYTHYPCNA